MHGIVHWWDINIPWLVTRFPFKQRKDYADIAQFLPPKFEYVIKIRLSEKQREMYKYYLETFLTDEGGLRRGNEWYLNY